PRLPRPVRRGEARLGSGGRGRRRPVADDGRLQGRECRQVPRVETRQCVQGETRPNDETIRKAEIRLSSSGELMPYPEPLIAPMRGELVAIGARELRTASAV